MKTLTYLILLITSASCSGQNELYKYINYERAENKKQNIESFIFDEKENIETLVKIYQVEDPFLKSSWFKRNVDIAYLEFKKREYPKKEYWSKEEQKNFKTEEFISQEKYIELIRNNKNKENSLRVYFISDVLFNEDKNKMLVYKSYNVIGFNDFFQDVIIFEKINNKWIFLEKFNLIPEEKVRYSK